MSHRAPAALFIVATTLLGGCYFDFSAHDAGPDETIDAGVTPDAPGVDAPVVDAAPPDDAPVIDAMEPADAAPPDADPADAYIPPVITYTLLSQTGLYSDITTKTLAPGVIEFTPHYKLWTDGALKRRWILLPAGTQVDTTNMAHWRFPIGTKVWKEFAYDDNGFVRMETRLIERTGPDRNHVWMGSFEWNAGETEADYRQFGRSNVKSSDHDIPATQQCPTCHRGEDHAILGFSAVQLTHGDTNNIDQLRLQGLFTNPPAVGGYPVPGTQAESDALGYMNANCGHCHNPQQGLACNTLTGLSLRVYPTDVNVLSTDAYTTAVGQPLQYWTSFARGNEQGFTHRIIAGDSANSALYWRANTRDPGLDPPNEHYQMPPDFTEFVDPAGVAALQTWIDGL